MHHIFIGLSPSVRFVVAAGFRSQPQAYGGLVAFAHAGRYQATGALLTACGFQTNTSHERFISQFSRSAILKVGQINDDPLHMKGYGILTGTHQ